jgi:hypothetical protein
MLTFSTSHMVTPVILLNTRFTLRTRFRRFFDCFFRGLFFFFPARTAGDAVLILFAGLADVPRCFMAHALAEVAGYAGKYRPGGSGDVGLAAVAGCRDAPVKVWVCVYDGAGQENIVSFVC